jgi:nucleoside-diphosphate-sugar epimerase
MDSHSNKVLITGGNGFTGKYLKKYLENNGYVVFGLSNTIDKNNKNDFKCDINNRKDVIKLIVKIQPNYVFHLAAISFVQHQNVAEIYNVNVIGTQNLLEACIQIKDNQLKKIILASSATVYGNQTEAVLDETTAPNPINHYGISKLAMEQIAKTYFNELPIIITRPFNYTAPGHGEQFVIPKIAKAFINKEATLELGNTNVFREYNSIDYVVKIYFELMKSNINSQIVNIASGKTHSLQEIISIFTNKSGHNLKVQINPKFFRKDEIKSLSGSTKKLKKIIKYLPTNSIEEVVDQFLN